MEFIYKIRVVAIILVAMVINFSGGAAELKQIHRGAVAIIGGFSNITVTIDTINTTKSFLVFSARVNASDPEFFMIAGEITDPTTLTFFRFSASGGAPDIFIEWQVFEFVSGVNVQHGSNFNYGVLKDTTISLIDTNKTFVICTRSSSGNFYDINDGSTANLINDTTLRLQGGGVGNFSNAYWQVIEYDSCIVQKVIATLIDGDISDAEIINAVNKGKTMIIGNHRQDSNLDAEDLARTELTNDTIVTFTRTGTTGNLDFIVYAVEFTDSTIIQHGSVSFANGETSKIVNIAPVDTNCSGIIAPGNFGRQGSTSNVGDDNVGYVWFTFELINPTSVIIKRDTFGEPAVATFQVVTYAGCSSSLKVETLVNTETAENQKEPDIAIDSSGNYIIVWESIDQDGDAEGIYAQRFNSVGDTVGLEFRVNVNTVNAQKNPAIAMNDIGEYVIVWDSKDQDGDKEGIYAQYYEPNHSIREPEFLVNTVTVDKQMNPDIALDNSGVFVVVWESNNGGAAKKDVYAQLFDNAGQPQGNEIQVNTFTANDQKNPAVGMNPNTGEFVVVWQSKNQNGAINKEEIYAQRFDNTGSKIGVEFLVNVTISDVQKDPAICMDTSKFIIAWVSDGQDGDGRGIYAQIHDNTGGVLRTEFLINTETTDDQDKPSIGCSDCAGGFNIVWESMGQDGNGNGVFGKIYDASGDTVSGEFQINTSTTDNQEKPVVTPTVRDTFIVAWQSDQTGDQDVYKQRYIYSPDCNALRVNAGANDVICSGDSIVIGGSPSLPTAYSGTPPYTYSWSPDSSLSDSAAENPTAFPIVTTDYIVTVTDNIGSVKTDTVTIIVDFVLPVANITPSDSTSFCLGDSIELVSDIAGSYQWLLNGTNTFWITESIIVFSAGDYQVVVKNSCGIDTSIIVTITDTCSETCSDGIQNQDETSVDCGGTICPACPEETCNDNIQNQNETGVDCGGVCPPCNLNIPSVFTPNGDGTNDKWIIRGTEPYPGILVEVYNRWGSLIFSSPAGYPVEWDGKNVPDGVYYYIITLGNGQEPRTGTVTIVR